MQTRLPGLALVAAATLFWVSWLLMPGVGVTDAERIFELVSSQRTLVMLSVITQLASAALYVPALMGLACASGFANVGRVRWAAGTLLLGAMGSAADAVFHLLAYAMTAPDVDRDAQVPVMVFMQGPGLLLVAPFILCFFIGGAWLSVAFFKAGRVSRVNPWLHAVALALVAGGAAGALGGLVSPRAVGLGFLAVISTSQAWLGVVTARERTV